MLYTCQGTCSKFINVETDAEGRISHCQFIGGCPGNTQGVARLVIGKTPEEVKALLDGVRCGNKPTSCPDQLCRALEQLKKEAV